MAHWRRRGAVIAPVLAAALRHPYFRLKPPRTAGREQFGRRLRGGVFGQVSRRRPESHNDALATATALTAETIARSYARFVRPKMKGRGVDFHSFRRRGAEQNAGGDAGGAAGAAGMHDGDERQVRNARRGQGGGGVCAAGVANVASAAGKRARGDGSEAGGGAGAGHVCRVERLCFHPCARTRQGSGFPTFLLVKTKTLCARRMPGTAARLRRRRSRFWRAICRLINLWYLDTLVVHTRRLTQGSSFAVRQLYLFGNGGAKAGLIWDGEDGLPRENLPVRKARA